MAQYKTEELKATRHFTLSLCIKSRTAKRHYIIGVRRWSDIDQGHIITQIEKDIDPHGNKRIKGGSKWKFYSKEEAKQLFTFITVKWG